MPDHTDPVHTVVIAHPSRLMRDLWRRYIQGTAGLSLAQVRSSPAHLSDVVQDVDADWILVAFSRSVLWAEVQRWLRQRSQAGTKVLAMTPDSAFGVLVAPGPGTTQPTLIRVELHQMSPGQLVRLLREEADQTSGPDDEGIPAFPISHYLTRPCYVSLSFSSSSPSSPPC